MCVSDLVASVDGVGGGSISATVGEGWVHEMDRARAAVSFDDCIGRGGSDGRFVLHYTQLCSNH